MSDIGYFFENLKSGATTSDAACSINDMVSDGYNLFLSTSNKKIFVVRFFGNKTTGNEVTWPELNTAPLVPASTIGLSYTFFSPSVAYPYIFFGNDGYIWGVSNTYVTKTEIPFSAVGAGLNPTSTSYTSASSHVSTPCFAGNKIWMLDTVNYNEQNIKIFDCATNSFTTVPFQAAPQTSRSDVATDGVYVYYTSWNSLGVVRYNIATNSFDQFIRVNGSPYKIRYCPKNNRMYVASYGGMISYIDCATGLVTHVGSFVEQNALGTVINCDGIIVDFVIDPTGNYIWAIDGTNFSRIEIATGKHIFTDVTKDKDYHIDSTAFTSFSFSKLLLMQEVQYQQWNGTSMDNYTAGPYLVIAHNDTAQPKVSFMKLDGKEFYKQNSINATGHTMVSFGIHDYTGE